MTKPSDSTVVDLESYWHDLFGAALLGTDRRPPPDAPPAPIAELLVELPPPDAAAGLLDQVAAAAALRRAGSAPIDAAAPLQPPPPDPRPEIPATAVTRLAHILDAWPVLEHEWLRTVVANGWRLGPDTTVALLRRHRTDGHLRPLVEAAAGPLAAWLAEHVPSLAGGKRTVPPADPAPHLAGVPPELVAVASASGEEIGAALRARLRFHRLTAADRAPLVAYVVHLPPGVLGVVAMALAEVYGDAATTMLAAYLADLATTRNQMLHDLTPTDPSPPADLSTSAPDAALHDPSATPHSPSAPSGGSAP